MFGTLDLFSCFHIYRPHKLGDIYCPLLSWMKFPMRIYNIESSALNSLEEKWNLRDVLLQFVEVLCHVASIMSPNGMRLAKLQKDSTDSIVNLWSILCHKQFGFICVMNWYSISMTLKIAFLNSYHGSISSHSCAKSTYQLWSFATRIFLMGPPLLHKIHILMRHRPFLPSDLLLLS